MHRVITGFGSIEGPVWNSARGLYFSDVANGGVYLRDLSSAMSVVLPRRQGVRGLLAHADGGLILGGDDIVHVAKGANTTIVAREAVDGPTGFSGFTTDEEGRIYFGSLPSNEFDKNPQSGLLHIVDLDGSVRPVSTSAIATSDLSFSPDGARLYICSPRSTSVHMYDVNMDGSLKPGEAFASLGSNGQAKSLKVASDGSVWVADAYGGRVVVFDANGVLRRNIPVASSITGLCFGGEDLRELHITTSSEGSPHVNAGSIFCMKTDVPGLPSPPTRVTIQTKLRLRDGQRFANPIST